MQKVAAARIFGPVVLARINFCPIHIVLAPCTNGTRFLRECREAFTCPLLPAYIYIYIYIYFAYDANHKREVLLCRGGARMTYRATDLDISFSPYETPISRYSVFGDVVVHTSSLNYQLRVQRYTIRDYFTIEQLRDTVATACSYRSDRGGQGTAWKISVYGYGI